MLYKHAVLESQRDDVKEGWRKVFVCRCPQKRSAERQAYIRLASGRCDRGSLYSILLAVCIENALNAPVMTTALCFTSPRYRDHFTH